MAFLLGKDWNVLTITFERADLFRINGNRTKGRDANKIKDNAKRHARTIFWAVFNQKGKVIESGPGVYGANIPAAKLELVTREVLGDNESVRNVLEQLQTGESDKAAKILELPDDKTEPAAAAPPAAKAPTPKAPAATKPAAAAAAPAPRQRETTSVYRLVVASDEGDEFESSLKLIDRDGQLSGTLLAPDGEAAPIERARRDGSAISFEFKLGAGEEALSLKFQGTIDKDLVKGKFS